MVFDSVSECWHRVSTECEAAVSTHKRPKNVVVHTCGAKS